ncbi:MAG: response regulator [Clostridiales bacterium]|nr:response regulator [Clostridiales bacterium]
MKRFWRCATASLLCVLLLWMTMAPAMASEPTTLRVAFYPLEGFFSYDADGNETGYGVELLNRITRYTGIQFTYVKASSWESTKEMLLNGKADLRMPGTLPSSPSTTLEYTQHSVLDTYYALMTSKNRNDLIYDDFDTFSSVKVAVSSNLYQSASIEEYLESMNLTKENFVFCEEYSDCREALAAGQVDALISNIMDLDDGMKILSRFSSCSNYISMTIGNSYLNILDEALFRITMEDPTFLSSLYSKWFPERATIPFTKEELAFLADTDCLRFYFNDEQGYLSHALKDGSLEGIYPSVARSICNKLGVDFKRFDTSSWTAGDSVILPDFYYDYAWADECDAAITDSYMTANYYEITLKGRKINRSTAMVAAVEDFRVTKQYIQPAYKPQQMVWCKDYAACMEAVYSGKADITYVNRYTAEYYLNLYRYSSLSATIADYSHQICFAVIGEDKELIASILNKCLISTPADELNDLIVQETSVKPQQNLIAEWFYQDPVRSTTVICLIVIGAFLLANFIFTAQKNKRKNAALIRATHIKQDFLSRMSHDMRTPMNAIISYSGFGVESKTLSEAQEYHGKIHDASKYLLQLINDTLDLSKIEAGTLKLHPTPCQMADFIGAIENILRPRAIEKGVSFTVISEGVKQQSVLFDQLRLQQIFINLLNNAIKFTPAGGHVTFEIAAEQKNAVDVCVTFSVKDDGIGMTEAFQTEQLYKPFVQERRLENAESGTGLGLSIVKELVTAMGGTISCKSAPGKGTSFTVVINAKVSDVANSPAEAADEGAVALSGRKILLCEDQPLNREIARKLLEKAGAHVMATENGRECLCVFNASPPGNFDAILMDIRMPVMNGLDATRRIRALNRPDARHIPIVAMTANAFDEDRQESMSAGMNAHLAKPIDPRKLYATLAKLIRNQ